MDTNAVKLFLSARPELLAKGVTVDDLIEKIARAEQEAKIAETLSAKKSSDATLSVDEFIAFVQDAAEKISSFVAVTPGQGVTKNTKHDRRQVEVPTSLGTLNLRLVHDNA